MIDLQPPEMPTLTFVELGISFHLEHLFIKRSKSDMLDLYFSYLSPLICSAPADSFIIT